ELGGGFLGQRSANPLEGFHAPGGGFDGQFARQQEIASVAGLHGDDVAAVADLIDVFLKDYFLHCDSFLLRSILAAASRSENPDTKPTVSKTVCAGRRQPLSVALRTRLATPSALRRPALLMPGASVVLPADGLRKRARQGRPGAVPACRRR